MGKWAVLAVAAGCLLAAVMPVRTSGAEAASAKDSAAADGWSELKPLALTTPFDNVRYPNLDARGNVTFIADDGPAEAGKKLNHGIFRYQADGTLACLVRAGETTVPGEEATLKTIQSLQMDENSVDFVFNAFDSAGKRGLYHWSKGQLDTVARTGVTILPDATKPLNAVEYGTLYGTHVLYKASAPGLGGVLVLHDLVTEQDRVVCHTGMPIPGRSEETFKYIGSTNWVNGDSIIFRAASVAQPGGPDARGKLGVYGWFNIKDWSGANGEFSPERLRTVVDGSASVPVADVPKDSTFDSIKTVPASGSNAVFWALGVGFSGIFTAKTPDGPIRCIVSNHTEFGGPFKGRFTSFGSYPAVIGQNVIFTAEASDETPESAADDDGADDAKANEAEQTYKGIFVYRLDRGEVFTLADNRAPLGGKEIEDLEIGGHVLVDNHFAVAVTFKDKSSTVFLGTIKPEAFKRLTGGATDGTPKKPE